MTDHVIPVEQLLTDLRVAVHRRRSRRRRRTVQAGAVLVAGVAATVALGATYGNWLSSPNRFRPVAAPFAVPAFSGNALITGTHVSNATIRGHAGFILAWQSYCPPCKGDLVSMAAFAKANPTVPVIGFDIDDTPTNAATYLKELDATNSFPSIGISDPGALRISGYPTILAFNKNGQIVALALGYGGTVEPAILQHELAQLR